MTQQSDHYIGGIEGSLLNAYIDGELEREQMERIKRQLASDVAASRYVTMTRRFHLVSRTALDETIDNSSLNSLKDRLITLKEAQHTQPVLKSPGNSLYRMVRWPQALAAGIALVTLGFGIGFFSSGYQMQQQMMLAQLAREEGQLESRQVLNRVLEHGPSGERVVWKSGNGRVQGELLPVRTVKLGDKEYCREFHEILIVAGQKEVRRGLSCRAGKELWKTKMVLPEPTGSTF